MKNELYELIKQMLGDSESEFIARNLRESYEDLLQEKQDLIDGKERTPIWSYSKKKELRKINRKLQAIKRTYAWYSTDRL